MRQAIEEHYILDVLSNYTTIKEAFKLIRVSEDNPELIEGQTSRALFKYYKKHGYTIAQKTEMIMQTSGKLPLSDRPQGQGNGRSRQPR